MPFRFLLLALALIAPVALAVPAVADDDDGGHGKKPYEVTLSPSTAYAGTTVGGFKIKLTNKARTQKLGSANVTAPAALTLVGAPSLDRAGSVSASGGVLALRNLSLPPGKSVTVTVGVRMPCVAGSYKWAVAAKQANHFSGEPGNDFGPLSGNLNTTVAGTCALRFVAEPASAERNAQIRAEAFRPASPQLVSVEAIDGSPAPQRLTWFTGTIGLRLVQPGPGVLTPNPASSAAVAGLASFPNLAIDESGNYNLEATASGFVPDVSGDFQIIGVVEPCDATSCTAQLAGTTSTSLLTGAPGPGTGFALLSLNLGPDPVCAGYTPPSPDWYEFNLTTPRAKTITTTYSKAAMTGRYVSKLQICFAAPETFKTRTGVAQPFDYDGDPANGAEGFVGLLPDCNTKHPSSPCITKRDSLGGHHDHDDADDDDDDRRSSGGGGGGAIVKFFVPASWGDPRYH